MKFRKIHKAIFITILSVIIVGCQESGQNKMIDEIQKTWQTNFNIKSRD